MGVDKVLLALALIFAHVFQIVLPFIPGHFVPLAAGYYFGMWGLAVDWIGMLTGSLTAFYLARKYGEPLVLRFVERDRYVRLVNFMRERGVIGLGLLFVIPGMPKDALCFVAGVSGIRFLDFLMIVLFIRFPADAILVMVGAGIRSLDLRTSIMVGALGFFLFGAYFILSRRWRGISGM